MIFYQRYVETVAALMVHIMQETILGLLITVLVMKEEWIGIRDLGQSLNLLGHIRKIRRRKMITERSLKRWRKEALESMGADTIDMYKGTADGLAFAHQENLKRILRMTQELLDLHLVKDK